MQQAGEAGKPGRLGGIEPSWMCSAAINIEVRRHKYAPMPSPLPHPGQLGLSRTLQFTSAPVGRTFYYAKRKNEPHGGHLPVIESDWEDAARFRRTLGPFIYAVADHEETVKYIGKSRAKYLYQRWLRPQPYIHHRESRGHILAELQAGRGPLHLWSASAADLKRFLPTYTSMPDGDLITALEALWLERWLPHLWNWRAEPVVRGFTDFEYWRLGPSSRGDA